MARQGASAIRMQKYVPTLTNFWYFGWHTWPGHHSERRVRGHDPYHIGCHHHGMAVANQREAAKRTTLQTTLLSKKQRTHNVLRQYVAGWTHDSTACMYISTWLDGPTRGEGRVPTYHCDPKALAGNEPSLEIARPTTNARRYFKQCAAPNAHIRALACAML